MTRMLQSFFLLLASATDRQMAKYVEYLKAENRILRDRLPRHIRLSPRERNRLVRLGRPLGHAIKQLICVVSPRTFLRWLNGQRPPTKSRRPGRPKTPDAIRNLVLRIAGETGWGYTRILGELKKLGIRSISKSTVRNILREAGLDPGPKRGEGSWFEFIQRHASTLWACDFFSTKVWTLRGRVDVFVLFFIHLGSRQVHVSGITTNPDRVWMIQQARNIMMTWSDKPDAPRFLLRDHDSKFVPEFDALLQAERVGIIKVGPMAPNLNAYAERWVQAIRQECLDHFVIAGIRHLEHLVSSYLTYYHAERPHQGIDNRVPSRPDLPEDSDAYFGEVYCTHRLGGLLKNYAWRAA